MSRPWVVFEGVYPPREDSQLIVEVLERQNFSGKTVLDMGTGTGILTHTALKQGADRVCAVDVNPRALRNAMENIERSKFAENRVVFIESDLFQRIGERFDSILFNPPYVPGGEELGTAEERSWAGGAEGREVIDCFLDRVTDHLTEQGEIFLLQSSLNSVEQTLDWFETHGYDTEIVGEEKIPWERLVVIHATQ